MHKIAKHIVSTLLSTSLILLLNTKAVFSQDYYADRQIKLTTGGVGSGNDIYSRFLARYLPAHIPGRPVIVVVNMEGADSMVAANYINNRAPKDGTEIVNISQALPMMQAFGDNDNIKFDLAMFQWIGNMSDSANVLYTWYTAPVRTIEDAKRQQITIGSANAAALSSLSTVALNNLVGTKFRIVNGYPSGGAIDLATERGEVEGRGSVTWAALKASHGDWVHDKKINVLVQFGRTRDKELITVPLLSDLVKQDDLAVANFLDDLSVIARAFAVGPDIPSERVAILRKAFVETLHDPDFLSAAKTAQLDMSPMDGETLQKVVVSMVHADPKTIAGVKKSFKPQSKVYKTK